MGYDMTTSPSPSFPVPLPLLGPDPDTPLLGPLTDGPATIFVEAGVVDLDPFVRRFPSP
jgi:hypothetical protein